MASDWNIVSVDNSFKTDLAKNRAWLEIDANGQLFLKYAPQGQTGGSVVLINEQPLNGDPAGHGAGQGRMLVQSSIPNWWGLPVASGGANFVPIDSFGRVAHEDN